MRVRRVTTTVSLSEDVWRKAKEHGIPLSAVCELALVKILAKKFKVIPESYYLIKLKEKNKLPQHLSKLLEEVDVHGEGED